MSYETVKYEIKDHIAVIILNQPDKLNAFSFKQTDELYQVFVELDKNRDVRCVIITGAGRAFSAGGDIAEESKYTPVTAFKSFKEKGYRLTSCISNFRTPVIAAVNGYALGGGMELMLACDIRILSDKAVVGLVEVSLGTIPGWGGSQRAVRLIGIEKTLRIVAGAQKLSATEAYEMGLASQVVKHDELMDECLKLANRFCENPPLAVEYAKIAINQGAESSLEAALTLECALSSMLFGSEDCMENMRAFVEKRKPRPPQGK